MSIKKKFITIAAISVGMAGMVGLLLFQNNNTIRKEFWHQRVLTDISDIALKQLVLMNEYIQHHEKRPVVQMQLLSKNLDDLLLQASGAARTPDEQSKLSRIRDNKKFTDQTFSLMVATFQTAAGTSSLFTTEWGQVVINKSLGVLQEESDLASKLADASRDRVVQNQQQTTLFILLSIIGVSLITISIIFLVWRSIGRPLLALKEAVVHIASLDFTHVSTTAIANNTAHDEVGVVSDAFHAMAAKLKESYADLRQRTRDLEAARAKDAAILVSIGDAVIACDKGGHIILFNYVAEELTGYSAREAINQPYNQIVRFVEDRDGKPSDDFIGSSMAIGRKHKITGTISLIKKDGTKIPVADSIAPVKDASGRIIGCVVVLRDITIENAIDKAKIEFVSLVSHQLKTAPTAIRWTLELFLKYHADNLTKKQKEYLYTVYARNEQMIKIVNSLLDVSRIELGTFNINPTAVDIALLIRGVISESALEIHSKELHIKEQYPKEKLTVYADEKLLRMIITNTLNNAIQYTSVGGEIAIDVVSADAGEMIGGETLAADSVVYMIADTGCGIPKRQQDKIFTKLFRADNAQKRYTDGTGLGLYIVKSILDSIHGTIWFHSEENKGTTFYIAMPLLTRARKGRKR